MFARALATSVDYMRKSTIKPLKQDAEFFLVNNKNASSVFIA